MDSYSKIADDFKDIKWDFPKFDFPKFDFPFFQHFHPFKDEQDFIVMIVFVILLLLLILSQQKN